jgi:hypothetical protein
VSQQSAIWPPRDAIREGTANINPELPPILLHGAA